MHRWTSVAAVAICLAAGWLATAQDVGQTANKKVAPEVKLNQRASQIMGMKIRNGAGQELGTVHDIVLDVSQGNIRYLAVSYGGLLGLGDKLFAVPHKSFEWRQDGNRVTYLVLNLPEERLKSAPGFAENDWPDFANDKQWGEKIDAYYRVEKVEVKRSAPAR